MKKLMKLSLMIITIFIFSITSNLAQVAPENSVKIEAGSSGLALVGKNSGGTQAGPYFGGTIAYGAGQGVSLFAESGYGYTNYDADDNLSLVQVPVLVGAVYNFGEVLNSDLVQPYAGLAAGVSNHFLQNDWNTVKADGYEQKSTNFAFEGILGVDFQITPAFAVNVRGQYTHGFKKDGDPGLDSQEFNSVKFGGGLSYTFSMPH
ncbi:MAG TPA: outer membrane beta-barrel protein [Ignavibacteriaceae bacterium]|nr:outer membrane beta-barrel protein [Ignavibacteriaceae bacterium]